MEEKEFFIGIGILVMLLALAGTVSASSDGSKGFACNNCHAITPENATFYNQTHRYNETLINPPNCDLCHVSVSATPFSMNLALRTGTPTYLTSSVCKDCHREKYDQWRNSFHRVMLNNKTDAQAMNLPTPEVGWANISYVIITKSVIEYINTTGWFPSNNSAWETREEKWGEGHSGEAYKNCARCHSTGYNATNGNQSGMLGIYGSWEEPGIGCERCHKPAGNGHQVDVNYSPGLCQECHTKGTGSHGTRWESGAHAPPAKENGSCMYCHSPIDQYKNPNVTVENAGNVVCAVCHNVHDLSDDQYGPLFSPNGFNETIMADEKAAKLSFFNATASTAAGADIYDILVSPAEYYPGTGDGITTGDARKDPGYGAAPISVTGAISNALCSKCHFRHGLGHIAAVNLSHGTFHSGNKNTVAACIDCHMEKAGSDERTVMRRHSLEPLGENSCGGATRCHTTSAQNLSASSHSVIPVIREWKASAHNDMEVGVNKNPNSSFYRSINGTTGVVTTASRMNSCEKCHSPFNWNPLTDFNSNGTQNTATVKLTPDNFKGITCDVCHNLHDMGDWLAKTNATFGESKAYAWYNKDAVVAATNATTGAVTRYKANYTMMPDTVELCGNCHSNIRIGNEGPGWNGSGGNPTGVHGFPAKDIFVGSSKQTNMKFECISCHKYSEVKNATGGVLNDSEKITGHSFKVNEAGLSNTSACSSCHAAGSAAGTIPEVIEDIQAATHTKWNSTNTTVMAALTKVKAYTGEKNLSRAKIAQAYWNLRLVSSDESWGVHDPVKVNNLLNESLTLANDSVEALGSTETGRTDITSFSPATPTVIDVVGGATRTFSITVNQAVNISWQINEEEVANETGVTTSSYPTSIEAPGTWNVTAVAQNANGSAMQKWTWIVNPTSSETGSISGMKFNDINNNSIKDAGEPVLEGTTILLTITGGSTATMTTDANGSYTFSNLEQGNYTVEEVIKPDWKQTLPANGSYNVTIAGGENLAGLDFGNNLPVTPPVNVTIAVRMIEKESLRQGGSTNITVDISSNMIQGLSLHEIIPAGWNLTRISDGADAFKSSTGEWIWFKVTPGVNKTIIYRLTAPDNASIGTYHINGTLRSSRGVIAVVQGDNAVTLDIGAFYRRLGSDNDKVETTDVLTAVEDWRNNLAPAGFELAITTQELLALIDEWIGG